MTDTLLPPALDKAMKDVLERMFFLDACTCPAAVTLDAASAVEARLHFAGDPSGEFRLRVAVQAAASISADFLGIDPADLTESRIHEVVCEMANMICGAVLSRIESGATFRLGAPEIGASPCPIPVPKAAANSVETASGIFTAILITENSECPPDPKRAC